MNLSYKKQLEDVYKRYGFEVAKHYEKDETLVFTLKTGYFDNADIIPLTENADCKRAFDEFSMSGFACTIRKHLTISDAEDQLFKGFFSVESIISRQKTDYSKFTKSIVSHFSESARYEYINAPYLINNKPGEKTPSQEVIERLSSKKPTLFLIEAAAGFGKTCTAYELVHELVEQGDYLPLFSELSRNRQASIFRYILLDEIDHTFPTLSSRLVQSELKRGRVITILDGFDELLRKTEDSNDFETKEPMLETIGEFLTDQAKIVLTTRRTILFEGDAFHSWVETHASDFDLVRIKINEPRVADWIKEDRLLALKDTGLNLEHIANPVLLSYLRCIPDSEFQDVISNTNNIVDKYFNFMLAREKKRQDLPMSTAMQEQVLTSIADDMLNFSYTSEHRDYIVDQILRDNSKLIDETIQLYSGKERPSREEVANKLASHALLDRSSREPNKIAFINEFVFGNFIAKCILKSIEWISDDMRFIDPAVTSYQPRSNDEKKILWDRLHDSLDFLDISNRIDISVKLLNSISFELHQGEASGLDFNKILIGEKEIVQFQFNECTFRECNFDLEKIKDVTFLNCRFYGNTILNSNSSGKIFALGSSGDPEFLQKITEGQEKESSNINQDNLQEVEKFILEKFWPIGRETISHKHRPIKGICVNNGLYKPEQLYHGINSLKRKGILSEANQVSFLEINFEEINEIRKILGKD